MLPKMDLKGLKQSLGRRLLQLKQSFWIYDGLCEQGLINTHIFKKCYASSADTHFFTAVHLEIALYFTFYFALTLFQKHCNIVKQVRFKTLILALEKN